MQALVVQDEVLPVQLVASRDRLRPVEGELIPLETPGYYDEVSQTWRDPDGQYRTIVANRGTSCEGFCGTTISTIVFDDRDEVSDD